MWKLSWRRTFKGGNKTILEWVSVGGGCSGDGERQGHKRNRQGRVAVLLLIQRAEGVKDIKKSRYIHAHGGWTMPHTVNLRRKRLHIKNKNRRGNLRAKMELITGLREAGFGLLGLLGLLGLRFMWKLVVVGFLHDSSWVQRGWDTGGDGKRRKGRGWSGSGRSMYFRSWWRCSKEAREQHCFIFASSYDNKG